MNTFPTASLFRGGGGNEGGGGVDRIPSMRESSRRKTISLFCSEEEREAHLTRLMFEGSSSSWRRPHHTHPPTSVPFCSSWGQVRALSAGGAGAVRAVKCLNWAAPCSNRETPKVAARSEGDPSPLPTPPHPLLLTACLHLSQSSRYVLRSPLSLALVTVVAFYLLQKNSDLRILQVWNQSSCFFLIG